MYIDPIDVDVHWGGNDLINLLLCHGILPCYDGLLSASSCVFFFFFLHPRAAFFWRESVDDLNSRNLCKRVSVVAEEDRTWKMVEDSLVEMALAQHSFWRFQI